MYKVEKYTDKFETYRLIDFTTNSFFEVVPERGGIIARFNFKGDEILYMDKETLHDRTKNIRGGIPVLFPICGDLKDGKYKIGEREYFMKQHGLARNFPWEVVSTSKADGASITLKFKNNEETKVLYPFDFEVIFTYELKVGALNIFQKYINKSDEDMPFYAGFHPYFYVKDKNAIELNINSGSYFDKLDNEERAYNGIVDFEKTEVNYIYESLNSAAGFEDKKRKIKVTMKYDSIFKYVVLWSLKGKEFVCIEPWMAKPDSLNSGINVHYLKAGENLTTILSINCKK